MHHSPTDPHFNAEQAERIELDTLIEKGMEFTIPKRSLLRHFGKPERRFVIQQPHLGTMDHLSALYVQVSFSQQDLQDDPLGESKRLMRQAKLCARIIAISVLDSKLGIRFFGSLLTDYFLWRVTPAKLFQLVTIINEMSNPRDFISSIRYLSATPRTTSPNLVEIKSETPAEQPD